MVFSSRMRQKVSLGRLAMIIGIVILMLLSIKNWREATRILNDASSMAITEEQNSNLKLSRRKVCCVWLWFQTYLRITDTQIFQCD